MGEPVLAAGRFRRPGLLEWYEEQNGGWDGDTLEEAGAPGFEPDGGPVPEPAPPVRMNKLEEWALKAMQGPLHPLIVAASEAPGDEELDRRKGMAAPPPEPEPEPEPGDEGEIREDEIPARRPRPAEEEAAFDDDPFGPVPPENRFLQNEPISDAPRSGDPERGAEAPAVPQTLENDSPHDSRRALARAPLPGDGPPADPPAKRAGARPEEQQVAALPLPVLAALFGGGLSMAEITALLGSIGLLGLGARHYLQQQGSGPYPTSPDPASRANPPAPRVGGEAEAPDRRPRPNGPRNQAEQKLWDFVDDVLGNVFPSQADEPGGRPEGKKGEAKDKEPAAAGKGPGPQPPGSPSSFSDVALEAIEYARRKATERRERLEKIKSGELQKGPPRHRYGPGGKPETQADVNAFMRVFIDIAQEHGIDIAKEFDHVGGGLDITRYPKEKLKELYLPNQARRPGDPPLLGSNKMDAAAMLFSYLYAVINIQRTDLFGNLKPDELKQIALAGQNVVEGFAYGLPKSFPDEDPVAFRHRLGVGVRAMVKGLTEFHEELSRRIGQNPATLDENVLRRLIREKKEELHGLYGKFSSPGAPGGRLPGQRRDRER